jgi:hypothetical protein
MCVKTRAANLCGIAMIGGESAGRLNSRGRFSGDQRSRRGSEIGFFIKRLIAF